MGWRLAVVGVGPARGNGGLAMEVDVRSSQVTLRAEDGSSCTWEVSNNVTVVNLTDRQITVTGVSYWVSWTASDGTSGVETNIVVVNDGGLTPGVTFAPREQRGFDDIVLRFTIPCRARFGDLSVRVDSADGMGSGDA